VAVRPYRELGKETVYRYLARDLEFGGIVRRAEGKDGRGLTDLAVAPLALGQLSYGTEVREMTAAYACLAAEGTFRKPLSYLLVTDRNGNVLLENREEGKQVFSPETARLMTQMLTAVTERGTAKKLRLSRDVDVAGKTGTSGSSMDKWFVGYTPYLAAGIWCGYPEGGRQIPSLSRDQLDVWDGVMRRLHRDVLRDTGRELRSFSTEGLVRKTVCRDSGCLPGPHCGEDPRGCREVTLWFRRGTEPKTHCHRHVSVPYDFEVGGVITDPEAGEVPERVSLLDIPWRDFPIQVQVRDAEYVWRPLAGKEAGKWWGVPFFINTVPRGRFVGITDRGGGRQFNAAAYDRIPPSLRESESRRSPEEESLLDGILTFAP
jgi:membrane peptidoglycan carboxypeptidase